MLECKCCKILVAENKDLRELVDRLVSTLAPKPVEPDPMEDIVPEDDEPEGE